MPEVVEIDFLKNEVKNILKNKKVTEAFINKEVISNITSSLFNEELKGKTLLNTRRYGKILIIDFSKDTSLMIHFLLTGFLKTVNKSESYVAQAGIIFEDGIALTVNGIMAGGFIRLLKKSEIQNDESIKKLGIDVLGKDFDYECFSCIIKENEKITIKEILINQEIIAGLGNAYSDEILFNANVYPARKCSSLRKTEIEKIYKSIFQIIEEAKGYGGASELGFTHLDGSKGSFHKHFKVHKREGLNCIVCGTKINTIKIKGRTSYYCPTCQR